MHLNFDTFMNNFSRTVCLCTDFGLCHDYVFTVHLFVDHFSKIYHGLQLT
jgi:hypothetical protein